ncbi:conserved hypothetical protein [Flavobacterium sp. 9AF]|uniref:VanW family protein n=1 Tax=Flavobacterium sp. 9AF TaxID=2653142 RepID=UPI0012F1958B|nr:VanW family protein [Flavobacterium sp. 9AF]VXA94085.1 conserved hypothetical protein [Flavobacterium sp. 9AF]
MILKRIIPQKVKLKLKLFKLFFCDYMLDFAKPSIHQLQFLFKIETKQEIKQGIHFDNKLHNFLIAKIKIEEVILFPNQIFSFWKLVGNPSEKNNFKKGRNIIDGKVSENIGGGLCQISSIVYVTALKAGLEIIERHNHSVDIYKESERFTPLGSDATVAYGYKDLRIKNTFPFPIRFSFEIKNNSIVCNIESVERIENKELNFKRVSEDNNNVKVLTEINGVPKYYSIYKKIKEL